MNQLIWMDCDLGDDCLLCHLSCAILVSRGDLVCALWMLAPGSLKMHHFSKQAVLPTSPKPLRNCLLTEIDLSMGIQFPRTRVDGHQITINRCHCKIPIIVMKFNLLWHSDAIWTLMTTMAQVMTASWHRAITWTNIDYFQKYVLRVICPVIIAFVICSMVHNDASDYVSMTRYPY